VKWLAHIIKGGNKNELPQKATPYSIITQDGATPEIPGIRNRKAAEYAQTISEIYKNAKR
jgi:hypothetical protein